VRFTPDQHRPVMRPVLGASSYASQDSLAITFGLGSAVDVLWPGGVRNRLYDVRPSDRIVLPEIPCDFAGHWSGL
jgi:enediyne biosynthesis protein E4